MTAAAEMRDANVDASQRRIGQAVGRAARRRRATARTGIASSPENFVVSAAARRKASVQAFRIVTRRPTYQTESAMAVKRREIGTSFLMSSPWARKFGSSE